MVTYVIHTLCLSDWNLWLDSRKQSEVSKKNNPSRRCCFWWMFMQAVCVYLDSWFVEHSGEYTWFMCFISMGNEPVMQGLWQAAQANQSPGGLSVAVLTPKRVITWSVSPQHLSFCLSAGRTPFPSYHPALNCPLKKILCSVLRPQIWAVINSLFYLTLENI